MMKELSELGRAVRELVLHIVEEVVDHDKSVSVEVQEDQFHLLVKLRTTPGDVGQVVGKGGAVVSGLRAILSALAGKNRIQLTFVYVTEQEKSRG